MLQPSFRSALSTARSPLSLPFSSLNNPTSLPSSRRAIKHWTHVLRGPMSSDKKCGVLLPQGTLPCQKQSTISHVQSIFSKQSQISFVFLFVLPGWKGAVIHPAIPSHPLFHMVPRPYVRGRKRQGSITKKGINNRKPLQRRQVDTLT